MSQWHGYELRGPDAAPAVEWLHVHAEVLGVHEGDDAATVWLAHELPALPFRGVAARAVVFDPPGGLPTGREGDAPIQLAEDLLVRPPWVARPAGFSGIELIVPRGGAFGSGEHASTQAALRCLHALWDAPSSLGDVGTGSGILALYAVVRGCPAVAACDVDPAAVAAARELLPGADVRLGGAEVLPPVDCVIANMTGDELRQALPAMLRIWTRRSAWVISGLRAHEVAPFMDLVPFSSAHRCRVGEFTALGYRGGAR